MKYLTTAAIAAGLFATHIASAQVYDAIANATTANYYTGVGSTRSGDITQVNAPAAQYDTVSVIYVATGSGTFNLSVNAYPSVNPPCPGAFTGLANPLAVAVPITIPLPGPGDPPFPQIWQVDFTVAPTAIGAVAQCFEFISDNAAFTTAYDNSVAISGVALGAVDINGFSIDTTNNSVLEPCPPVNEWYTFGAGSNWNVLFSLTDAPAPAATCALPNSVRAHRIDGVPVKKINNLLQTRVNDQL